MTTQSTSYFANEIIASKNLGDSVLTNALIIEKIAENCKAFVKKLENTKIVNIKFDDISGDGFTSVIYRLSVVFEDFSHNHFVVKVFNFSKVEIVVKDIVGELSSERQEEVKQERIQKFLKLHNNECKFYAIFNVRNIMPLPQIYHIQVIDNLQTTGFIIMEDLSSKACLNPISDGLNVEQIKKVVNYFIQFHVHLLCSNEDDVWKETNEEFLLEDELGSFSDEMEKTVLKFNNEENFKADLKRLRKTMTPPFIKYSGKESSEMLGLPNLIVHADLWTNNLLWECAKDGHATNNLLAIIDWQMSYKGNFMVDFARLFVTSTDFEVRKSIENWVFIYYYDQLNTQLKDLGHDKLEFTLENLVEAYEWAKVFQCMYLAAVIPFFQKAFSNKYDKEEAEKRLEVIIIRAKKAVREAIEILEKIGPQWLLDY